MNRCPMCHLQLDPPPPTGVSETAYVVAICDVIITANVKVVIGMLCERHLRMAYPSFKHAAELHLVLASKPSPDAS